jgi:cell wall-associated NlpC family hydrolase
MRPFFLLIVSGLLLASCGSAKKKYDPKIVIDPSSRNIPKESTKTPTRTTPKPKEREVIVYNPATTKSDTPVDLKIKNIVDVAQSFHGTPYRFGGTTASGMDCSGLVFTAFKEGDILLPRSSRDMATRGERITLNEVSVGDLVFFKTDRRRNVINHVGLVVEVFLGKVYFIHSSTSQGVIISSLDESYWNNAFVEVRRVI